MKKNIFRITIALVIAALIVLFYIFKLDKYFNMSNVNEVKSFITQFSVITPVIIILLFTILNLMVLPTAFFIFLSGYLYGFMYGFILAWIATIIACTAAFFNVRYFYRDIFIRKFGSNKAVLKLEEYTEKYKIWAVLFFRMIFIFPYNIQNVAYGLTSIKTWRYVVATVIGSIPQTLIFVAFGAFLSSGKLTLTGLRDIWLYIVITLSVAVSIFFTILLVKKKLFPKDQEK